MPGACRRDGLPCSHPAATYYRFDADVDNHDSTNQKLWLDWFSRHGIDDDRQVALDGWVVRNVDEHQIVVLKFWEPDDGKSDGSRVYVSAAHGSNGGASPIVMRADVIQLDREPEPFPLVVNPAPWKHITRMCRPGGADTCPLSCPSCGVSCGCWCHDEAEENSDGCL